MNDYEIGLDVGGTKMAATWVRRDGKRGFVLKTKVSKKSNAEQLLKDALEVIDNALNDAPGAVSAIGVGVPAIVDHGKGVVVWAPNIPGWNSFPLAERLSTTMNVPVFVGQDGHMATLGEWWLGAGKGVNNIMVLTLGTGIGGGSLQMAD